MGRVARLLVVVVVLIGLSIGCCTTPRHSQLEQRIEYLERREQERSWCERNPCPVPIFPEPAPRDI